LSLAILTPQGQIYAADQIEAARIVFLRGSARFVHTNLKEKAIIDGVIVEDGIIVGVAEIKTRETTLSTLRTSFNNEWLITANKIDFLKTASILFDAPGYGILYLKPDKMCLMVKITDESGAICCDYCREETVTQATCNGGTATRVNAFINMSKAKHFHQ